MKIFIPPTYTELVRVEIKAMLTKEMKYISFCDTTLEEVFSHVQDKLKVRKKGRNAIKVKVNIRISDKKKKWGMQKNLTVYIGNIERAIKQISRGIPKSRKY